MAVLLLNGPCVLFAKDGDQPVPITALEFSPDATQLVAVGQFGLRVYQWPSLKIQHTLKLNIQNCQALAFSEDGRLLALGGGDPGEHGTVAVFDWPELTNVSNRQLHDDSVLALAWVDSTRIAAGSLDHSVSISNVRQAETVAQLLKGHSSGVTSLAVIGEHQLLLSGGIDQSLRVWNLETSSLIRDLQQHTAEINAIAAQRHDDAVPLTATVAEDQTVRFWQPTIGRMVRYARMPSIPLVAEWLPRESTPLDQSLLIVACSDGYVRTIDADTAAIIDERSVLGIWPYAMAVHPMDGTFAVSGADGTLLRLQLMKTEIE